MLRPFPRHWLRASAALLLVLSAYVVPARAQQPEPPAADITFAIGDANHTETWPVSVREVAIDGKPIHLGASPRLR
jgi:hypothetical protein